MSISSFMLSLFGSKHFFIFCFKKILERQFYRSYLGFTWVFIRVIFSCVTYAILFGVIFGGRDTRIDYFDFIFSGLLAWSIFIGGLTWGTRSFEILRAVRLKLFLPEGTMVLAGIISGAVSFIPWLLLFLVFCLTYSSQPLDINLYLLLGVLQILLITTSLTLITSTLDAFGRDSRYATSLLSSWFLFCTPIFYELSHVPKSLQWIILVNPLTPILETFRHGLYGELFVSNFETTLFLGASLSISFTIFALFVKQVRARL